MNTLTRRQFIKTAAAAMPVALVGSELFATQKSANRPNIVFVFADQMRAHAMGCVGNKQVITPHLDKLASEGLLVTNAISCQPVCSPYRAQLLTGRYGHSTGVIHNDIRLPDSETVISELMKKQGYATGYIGKWHLCEYRDNPVDAKSRRGWDFWAVRNCSHQHSIPEYWLNDSKEPVRVPGWEPDVQTDLAVEFIKKNKQAPFCLFLSFGPPHNPYKAPDKYVEMYKDKKLTARPNVPGGKTKYLRQYYAMTTSLDTCMGRIKDALNEAGISKDTIVVFSSDHGDMLGSQGHLLKQRPWEESINIPFIIRYPRKIKAGQRRDWIVSSVDVMPTLLGLCDISIPSQVQGRDYSPTFLGKSQEQRDAAFLFNVHRGGGPGTDWRGIRTKQWTYAYHFAGDWVMYDLKNDPYQLTNLIDNPKFAAKKQDLRKQLESMRNELGESLPLKGRMPAPIRLPNRTVSSAQPIKLAGVPNLHKVSDNLYRSAQPTAQGMKNLRELGIETVINLRSFHSDRDEIGNTSLQYEHIYMKTWHPERKEAVRFLQIVTNPNSTPVLVHCQHGADRTGTMCALYRIAVQGWTKEEAIREMTEGGFGFHKFWKNLPKWIQEMDIKSIKKDAGIMTSTEQGAPADAEWSRH